MPSYNNKTTSTARRSFFGRAPLGVSNISIVVVVLLVLRIQGGLQTLHLAVYQM